MGLVERLEAVVEAAAVKPTQLSKDAPKKAITIDMGAGIKRPTLDGLGSDLWPRSEAVNSLAEKAARLKERGVATPYVYVDVRKFVSLHTATESDAKEMSESEAENGAAKTESTGGAGRIPSVNSTFARGKHRQTGADETAGAAHNSHFR